jgi:hypothetical protein
MALLDVGVGASGIQFAAASGNHAGSLSDDFVRDLCCGLNQLTQQLRRTLQMVTYRRASVEAGR